MILSEQVPVVVAMAIGAAGLVAGATFVYFADRDKLRIARRLVNEALKCEIEARRAHATARALTEPTGPISTIELFPPSLPRRMHRAVAEAVERFTVRNASDPDWAEGEMKLAFARADQEQEREKAPATPYVGPGASRGRQRAENAPAARPALPAGLRQWGPRLVHGLQFQVRMPERFGTLQLPPQRVPSPLVMARLPEDPTRAFRTKVVAA